MLVPTPGPLHILLVYPEPTSFLSSGLRFNVTSPVKSSLDTIMRAIHPEVAPAQTTQLYCLHHTYQK